MLGIAIGITSVVLVTSVSEGTRLYVLEQFTRSGTNLLGINPGRTQTFGIGRLLGGTTHKLTLDDAKAVERLPEVEKIVAMTYGVGRVEVEARVRSVFIYGVTPDLPSVWQFHVRQGAFWPSIDIGQPLQMAILGPKLTQELFSGANPLGRFVRINGSRFVVVGVMEHKGRFLGFDLDDSAYIPVAAAMKLFNLDELNEIDVLFSSRATADQVVRSVTGLLSERHRGNEDFTITTQAAMLEVSNNVMNILTMSVAAIAAISLMVGAIGILTTLWIAVTERTAEIGLIRAIGASKRQVRLIFLAEASALSTAGGILGLAAAWGLCALLRRVVPDLPLHTPVMFAAAALAVSLLTGLLSGVIPAHKAAALDPITALRAE
jgi:putative ABC transport system permease protein